ncbi:MAG: flotillin family protein [Deltaproteobacteria bacterium]|nr:flotillin family protein [Deltaproteobacteria bacterium]
MIGALILLILLIAAFVGSLVVKNLLYVCTPSEVLVFSGRPRQLDDGSWLGYRIIKGGRSIRMPIIETVDRIDLTNMIIEITVRNAYSKGGIPLTVQGVANIKVPGEEPMIRNTLERFLGRTREEIMRIARETLEGNLRGVLATLTPEQVNEDKEAFAQKLTEEAEHDLNRIGLVLDTLKIQNVSDDVGYLDAIGRMRSAHIRRNAQIAEAEAQAGAAEVKWDQHRQGELAKIEAAIMIARKNNERRITDATTKREAMIAEQQAAVQAAIAQTRGEIEMQTARIEQVKLQLQADVLEPAEAEKERAIAAARADASKVIEQGKATATVLAQLATTYRASGGAGRDVLLSQKLLPIMNTVTKSIGQLRVDRLTVIGASDGAGGGSLAQQLINASEQVKAATGVDVPEALRRKLGQDASQARMGQLSEPPPTPGRREQ